MPSGRLVLLFMLFVFAGGAGGLAGSMAGAFFGRYGLFAGGVNTLFVIADASGVATSPTFTANANVGAHFGSAVGFFDEGAQPPFVYFTYEPEPTEAAS